MNRVASRLIRAALFGMLMTVTPVAVHARIWIADPYANPGDSNYYRALVDELQPGDTLQLPAGTYWERLNLNNLQGSPSAWITITGPESGPPAILTTESNCCNTIQLGNTWYVAIQNLTIDSNSDFQQTAIDGINAKGGITHDIRVEKCILIGNDYSQLTVAITTKSTAWNWIIRNNKIIEAGTGIYLGDPSGSSPFIAGIIEGNLIVDTIGYNMQIKYQNPYSYLAGMPVGPNRTIIRDNVFIKRKAQADWPPASDGSSRVKGARPNLLVGGFPSSGPGAADLYEIYGNFFYRNPDESLLQCSGRVSIHDNIFVDASGTALNLLNHDLPLKLAHVYHNTIYGGDNGIRLGSLAQEEDAVVGNLVFAFSPISGAVTYQRDNITDSVANAANYVQNPSLTLGQMDFYPLPGRSQGSPIDLSLFVENSDYDLDFNKRSKSTFTFRGAYSGDGVNPGWQLSDEFKVIYLSAPRKLRIVTDP